MPGATLEAGEHPEAGDGMPLLGVAAKEDKIVHEAVTETILRPIFAAEFLGCSYRFRPGRGLHDALDALSIGITRPRIGSVFACDIQAFLDIVSWSWLARFLEHRVGDHRVTGLVTKWSKTSVQ